MAAKGQSWMQSKTDERRDFVRKLQARGFSFGEIVRAVQNSPYKVSEKTIKGDIRWLKKNPAYLPDINISTLVERSLQNMRDIRSELWRIYHSNTSPNIKLQALNSIKSWEVERWTILEKAGLIAGSTPIGAGPDNISMVDVLDLVDHLIEICGLYVPEDRWDEFLIAFKQAALEFGREHPDEEDNDFIDVESKTVNEKTDTGLLLEANNNTTKEE